MRRADHDRVLDLMAEQATQGLSADGRRELQHLLAVRSDLDGESLELAAAAIELAYTDSAEPLPAFLRDRLARQAAAFYGTSTSAGGPTPNRG